MDATTVAHAAALVDCLVEFRRRTGELLDQLERFKRSADGLNVVVDDDARAVLDELFRLAREADTVAASARAVVT